MNTRESLLQYLEKRGNLPITGRVQRILELALEQYDKFSSKNEQVILDLGTFNRRIHPRAINLDIAEGADFIVDITKPIEIEDNCADFIACTATLEHINNPEFVVSEIYRLLKKGGFAWVDVPFMQPFHGVPDDFQRYTKSGLIHLFRNFDIIECGAGSPNGFGLKWIFEEFRNVCIENGDYPHGYALLEKLFKQSNFEHFVKEMQSFDEALVDKYRVKYFPENMHRVATALYIYVEKK